MEGELDGVKGGDTVVGMHCMKEYSIFNFFQIKKPFVSRLRFKKKKEKQTLSQD